MDIFLYNTLTNKKELFKPIIKGSVSMYNCGPTVYNYAHIGNLRSYIFSDILRRMFKYSGYKTEQVINITDIGHLSSDSDDGEDKMTKALKREKKSLTLSAMREVADFYFNEFKKDLELLNIELPEKFPFASDHIKEDINLIKILTEKGFTYRTNDGIYFDISKFKDYGRLGNIAEAKDGQSRIGVNPEKKNSRDFAVWKFNRELGYDADFGKGFPGWHIECSAMSVKYLGPEFDIHTGGIDHIPVHHNNEIAQAVCAGYPYAHYWMHHAFVNISDGKMAKSDDNFIKLSDVVKKGFNPLSYRYLLLGSHYRTPMNFSFEALEGAENSYKKIVNFIKSITEKEGVISEKYINEFKSVIFDDLNTSEALAIVWKLIKDENISSADKKATLINIDKVLGLNLESFLNIEIPENIKNLIQERESARKDKDYVKSDKLRKEIEKAGYSLEDSPEGPICIKK